MWRTVFGTNHAGSSARARGFRHVVLSGRFPFYRCMRGGLSPNNWADHFETLDFNCENVRFPVNEGPIGYIWL